MLPEEGDHLLPAVGGGFLVVAGAVNGKEAVAGARIHMELVVLVEALQLCLGLSHIGRRWSAVLVSE